MSQKNLENVKKSSRSKSDFVSGCDKENKVSLKKDLHKRNKSNSNENNLKLKNKPRIPLGEITDKTQKEEGVFNKNNKIFSSNISNFFSKGSGFNDFSDKTSLSTTSQIRYTNNSNLLKPKRGLANTPPKSASLAENATFNFLEVPYERSHISLKTRSHSARDEKDSNQITKKRKPKNISNEKSNSFVSSCLLLKLAKSYDNVSKNYSSNTVNIGDKYGKSDKDNNYEYKNKTPLAITCDKTCQSSFQNADEHLYPLRDKFESEESYILRTIKIFKTVKKNEINSVFNSNFHKKSNCRLSKNAIRREPKIRLRNSSRLETTSNLKTTLVCDLYNEEYLVDIFVNIKFSEKEIQLERDFWKSPMFDLDARQFNVNWMLNIQSKINISDAEFYLSVHLFDTVLSRHPLQICQYQLLAATTIWISVKLISPKAIDEELMLSFCDNQYRISHLTKMESNVLKIINFKLTTIEPTLCVNYFSKVFKMDKCEIVMLTVYYVLDCLAVTKYFSTYPKTVISAAACMFAFKTFNQKNIDEMYTFFGKIFQPEEMKLTEDINHLIDEQIKNMLNDEYKYKGPFNKYKK